MSEAIQVVIVGTLWSDTPVTCAFSAMDIYVYPDRELIVLKIVSAVERCM